ncbi:hypothetical protein [Chitinibacter sp. S2-10]|uniref:hypothetical protein n=1 Tax=Chitinibacter sp. S2-10 TaxID=3373597 RepID=UPI0039779EC6
MAESELIQWLNDLCDVSEQLLRLANIGAWDDFEQQFPAYNQWSLSLPLIAWSDYSISDQQLIKDKLLYLQQQHDALLVLTKEWRAELQGILQSEVQGRKLDERYR